MEKISAPFFVLIGFAALFLGTVGIMLPILPTVPFYVFTVFCFTKGSPRFNNWLLNTKLYKKHMGDFNETKAMTLHSKLCICGAAGISKIITFLLAPHWVMQLGIVCLFAIKVYYFTFKIKTIQN